MIQFVQLSLVNTGNTNQSCGTVLTENTHLNKSITSPQDAASAPVHINHAGVPGLPLLQGPNP
jgi:hypothetical protein